MLLCESFSVNICFQLSWNRTAASHTNPVFNFFEELPNYSPEQLQHFISLSTMYDRSNFSISSLTFAISFFKKILAILVGRMGYIIMIFFFVNWDQIQTLTHAN